MVMVPEWREMQILFYFHFLVTSSFSNRFQIYPDKAPTRRRLASVFKFIHSAERFQIYPFSVRKNAVYEWTEPVTVWIFIRFQIYPDTCGRGLK